MNTDEAIQTVIIDRLKKRIIDNDMVATGALLGSVKYDKRELLQQITYEIIALDYIEDLNFGAPPGTVPSFDDISRWIEAKGLDLNPYAVINSIKNEGTTWYRQGGSNIVTDSINDEAFKEVIDLASQDLKIKIKEQWQLLFTNNR